MCNFLSLFEVKSGHTERLDYVFLYANRVILNCFYTTERRCYKIVCRNGGKCKEDPQNDSYKCACSAPQFTGKHCETGECSYMQVTFLLHTILSKTQGVV